MDIASLIAEKRGDRSYRTLAKACGGKPTHQRLQQLAGGVVKEWMEPDSIRGLARGLNVTPKVIVLSLAESMGLEVGASSRIDNYLPAGTDALTSKQLSAIGAIVGSMIQPEPDEEGDESWHGTPGPEDDDSPDERGVTPPAAPAPVNLDDLRETKQGDEGHLRRAARSRPGARPPDLGDDDTEGR